MSKTKVIIRRASLHGAEDRLVFFANLVTFCEFGDFRDSLAHFDPWTICDNSLK